MFYDKTASFGSLLAYDLTEQEAGTRLLQNLPAPPSPLRFRNFALVNGSCSQSALLSPLTSPLVFLEPAFLVNNPFKFVAHEYYLRDSDQTFFRTTHWSVSIPQSDPSLPPFQVDCAFCAHLEVLFFSPCTDASRFACSPLRLAQRRFQHSRALVVVHADRCLADRVGCVPLQR